jgi:hypothetical protein
VEDFSAKAMFPSSRCGQIATDGWFGFYEQGALIIWIWDFPNKFAGWKLPKAFSKTQPHIPVARHAKLYQLATIRKVHNQISMDISATPDKAPGICREDVLSLNPKTGATEHHKCVFVDDSQDSRWAANHNSKRHVLGPQRHP